MNTNKTILIVEDDSVISSSLTELLEDYGYNVLAAANGFEALQILKVKNKPSVILLDLMMPIMDGFQFRENQLLDHAIKDIPVIVMSADGHVVEKQVKTAAQNYLKKPLDIHHLLEIVEKYTT